ncbi:TPA: acyltransferase family protein [Legionella pneumophila]|nr:acyltransferase family protein [Legionella pneumophila]HAU1656672.1 acyltransferase [Legionella pneumophila]
MKINATQYVQQCVKPLQRIEALSEDRFLGIDLLRCLLALGVLLWHYQFFAHNSGIQFIKHQQPLYSILDIFYSHGWQYRVQTFWCISGFILFWKYGEGIANKLISGKKFFIGRFSRIYPLHLVTLFLVAFFNWIYFYNNHYYFTYQNNDLGNFLLHFFLASSWVGKGAHSFNGPVWSLSAEIPVYFIFFIFVRFLGLKASVNYFFIGFYLLAKLANFSFPIIDCVGYFYSGGLFAIYLQQFEKQNRNKFLSIYFVYILAIVLTGMHLLKLNQLTPVKYLLLINMTLVCFYYLSRIIKAWPRVQNLIKTMSHLTFSSYLIHFPIQIILTLFFGWLNLAIPFYSISFLTLFIAITWGVSYLSYHYFEKPLRVLIRNKFKYS